MACHRQRVKDLKLMANQIRRDVVEMIYRANAGHPGGSLSCVDLVTALYFAVMRLIRSGPLGLTGTGSSCRRDMAVLPGMLPSPPGLSPRSFDLAAVCPFCKGIGHEKTPG